MKKFWITLLAILMLVSGIAFVTACNNTDVLANYVLKEDGSLVDADFTLPLTIGEKQVKWESDKDAIVVEKRDSDYLAKVVLGDEATPVALTVSVGKETKKFEVTVAALDVYYFKTKYNFKQNNSTVFKDFQLDSETQEINGKKATIAWEVKDDADKNYISLDGATCKVKESPLNPTVRLYATFSYNGKTTTAPYKFTVSFEREPLEEVDYWYYNTGVSITMSGYVVVIGTAYSDSYGNVTLYMVNDDFTAGYYLYRVKADKENGALLKPGVHVTVTGTTNTNYNGLIETNAGGTLVVDKDKASIDVNSKVYAIDNDLLSGTPAALYHTSRLVSLDKWEVDSVEAKAPEAGNAATMFTLKKDNVKVTVGVSKYLEGAYATKADDAVWSAIVAKHSEIKKGDIVSVTGILGNYKGYQILPLTAESIKKEEGEASAIPEACTNVSKAIAEVNKIFKANGVGYAGQAGYIVVADKEFEVPATFNGVEIKYNVIHNMGSVTIADGKVSIKAGVEDIAIFTVTYTAGDYTTTTFQSIHSKEMSAEDVVAKVKFDFEFDITEVEESFDVPTTVEAYPGVTITWELKEDVKGISISDKGNKVNVIPSIAKDIDFVLIGTITYGEESVKTNEYAVKVLKADPNKYALTSAVFELGAYAKEGGANVNGVNFKWIGLGDYGEGIQMRTNTSTGTSSFWNEQAFLTTIEKVVFNWSDSKPLPTKEKVLKVEFSNNADFSEAEEKLVTFTDKKTLTITPEGKFTYVRITHNNNGAVYLKSAQVITIADPNKISVTSEAFDLDKYADGNQTINGIGFEWIELGDYGDGIQMRTNTKGETPKPSTFWNTDALNPISKLVLNWSDSKDLPTKTEVLKIEFYSNADFSDAKEVIVTFTDNKTLEVTIPEGSFKYVRITHNNNGAVYLKSVQIECTEPAAA